MVIACGYKRKILHMAIVPDIVFTVAKAISVTSLWYCRLGHMGQQEMKELLLKEWKSCSIWRQERFSVTVHLNKFSGITNQLSSVEIKFNDELWTLILLTSLSKSWETTTINNSAGKARRRFDNIRDMVLAEEVWRRDLLKYLVLGYALKVC